MTRERAREALRKLDELDAKRAQQEKLYQELRHRLEQDAYDSQRRRHGIRPGGNQANVATRSNGPHACGICGWEFLPGEEVLEHVDDDGTVIARRHYFVEECRRASERDPKADMRYT